MSGSQRSKRCTRHALSKCGGTRACMLVLKPFAQVTHPVPGVVLLARQREQPKEALQQSTGERGG